MEIQWAEHRESGEPGRDRRLICGLGAWVAVQRESRLSFGYFRRRLHRLALLPAGRYQGDVEAHAELGLRYEYTPFTSAYRGQTGTFDGTQARPIIVASETNEPDLGAQPAAATAYGYLQDLIQTSSQAGLPYSITYPDKNQWAPRFGFAWRPFGEATVLRGGYGVFFEGEYTDGRVNLFMPPFLLRETALADRAVVPTRTLAEFLPRRAIRSRNTTVDLTPTYTR